jgi:hypothetical protein
MENVIPLPGSEGWTRSYDWGNQLEKRFPNQDASDFASACEYNDYGPAKELEIVGFQLLKQGIQDEEDWIWAVAFAGGANYLAIGGCDYTGWDCQSWLEWYGKFGTYNG